VTLVVPCVGLFTYSVHRNVWHFYTFTLSFKSSYPKRDKHLFSLKGFFLRDKTSISVPPKKVVTKRNKEVADCTMSEPTNGPQTQSTPYATCLPVCPIQSVTINKTKFPTPLHTSPARCGPTWLVLLWAESLWISNSFSGSVPLSTRTVCKQLPDAETLEGKNSLKEKSCCPNNKTLYGLSFLTNPPKELCLMYWKFHVAYSKYTKVPKMCFRSLILCLLQITSQNIISCNLILRQCFNLQQACKNPRIQVAVANESSMLATNICG